MGISDIRKLISSRRRPSGDNDMRKFILDVARDCTLDVGHTLPWNVVFHKSLNFNPKQHDDLSHALNDLIEEGIFEKKNNGDCLTQKGFKLLYS